MKTNLSRPQSGNVSLSKVQKTISAALGGLFENNTVYCENHFQDDEAVIVMMANGVVATLHVQEMASGLQKGVAV